MTITINWGEMESKLTLQKKRTRCCNVIPEISQENKPNESKNEYHYKCPKCGANPCMVKIAG
jgi:hypothetical protein